MKIKIVTLHRVFNYGSVLQAYATQKVFEKISDEVEIIDYITEQRTFKRILFTTPKSINNIFKKFIYIPFKLISVGVKSFIFGIFIKKHIKLTDKKYISYQELLKDTPDADVYVTGSDQVWNSHYNEGIDKGFFLEFVPEGKKRISYASSFGKENLDKNEIEETKQLINKYDAISVREDTGLRILDNIGYKNAITVLDPTLQLTKEEWSSLSKKRLIKEKYILLFLLYNEDNGGTEYARLIAKQKGFKLVKLSWDYKKPEEVDILKSHKSPEEFLSLLQYSEFIITNSFHGIAFAINFNRAFIVVPRNEFNTRIESLLRLTHLEDRMITNGFNINIVDKYIDYEAVNDILNKERKKAENYIKDAILF